MSRLIGLTLLLAGVLYPFVVYFGLEHFAPWQLALLLGVLWLARVLTSPAKAGSRWMAGAAIGFCVLVIIVGNAQLLRWYPVLISTFMLGLFGSSLVYGPPVAERLARLREPELPQVAIAYTRLVTQVWSGFFLLNGLMAASLTLWAPLGWWTLYNGLIAYGLMGVLFAGEWLVRQRVRGRA